MDVFVNDVILTNAMTLDQIPVGASEDEIFEELKIRHELEPIESHAQYLSVIDEIITEKLDFGEIHADEDVQALKDNLARRFEQLEQPDGHTDTEEPEEVL